MSALHDHPDQLALGLALLRTDCLHVYVGRHLQTGVTKQLLHDLRVFPVRIQERSKRVSESVIRDVLGDLARFSAGLP